MFHARVIASSDLSGRGNLIPAREMRLLRSASGGPRNDALILRSHIVRCEGWTWTV